MSLKFGMNLKFGMSLKFGVNLNFDVIEFRPATITDRRNTRAAFILSLSKDECGRGGKGAGYSPRLITMLSGPRDSTASAGSS